MIYCPDFAVMCLVARGDDAGGARAELTQENAENVDPSTKPTVNSIKNV